MPLKVLAIGRATNSDLTCTKQCEDIVFSLVTVFSTISNFL